MKSIVTIGGGTGHGVLLRALGGIENISISAVVGMADNGGSSGVLRRDYGMFPPGDLRQCFQALSNNGEIFNKMWEYRFEDGFLQGHVFGNLMISSLQQVTGNTEKTLDYLNGFFVGNGEVLPVTSQNIDLVAKLDNGGEIFGEQAITRHCLKYPQKVVQMWLKPCASIYPKVHEAILKADYIIVAPGNIYSSIIPNFLVKGMPEVIKQSKAKKIYFSNLMSVCGRANSQNLREQIEVVQEYMGSAFDIVAVNKYYNLSKRALKKYASQKMLPTKYDKKDFIRTPFKVMPSNLVDTKPVAKQKGDLLISRSTVRHDTEKIQKILFKIINK